MNEAEHMKIVKNEMLRLLIRALETQSVTEFEASFLSEEYKLGYMMAIKNCKKAVEMVVKVERL